MKFPIKGLLMALAVLLALTWSAGPAFAEADAEFKGKIAKPIVKKDGGKPDLKDEIKPVEERSGRGQEPAGTTPLKKDKEQLQRARTADWSGWKYSLPIAIDNSRHSSPLRDYQIRIGLDSSNFDFSKTRPRGEDIGFVDSSNASLSYWIEDWNLTAEKAKIWVKVPMIAGSGITDITMYYGNASALSALSFEDTFISDSADFEADPPGTSFDSISFWGHESGTECNYIDCKCCYKWYGDVNPGTNPDAEDLSISSARYFTGSQSLYSSVRNSNARGGDCTFLDDPDCRAARHWLYNEDSYRLVANSDTIYIWATPIVYTKPSRYGWYVGVAMRDGTNTQYTLFAHRNWHGRVVSSGDDYDTKATGADGTTWRRYPISIAKLDKTNLTMEIRHLQDSWDGGTAHSSIYFDSLENVMMRKYSSPEPTAQVRLP